MNVDPDDEMGAHLDALLRSLETGQARPESQPQSADRADLEGLVTELHHLARFFGRPTITASGEDELPIQIGKYAIRQQLGSGGQSNTYLARDPDLERIVVIKRYHQAKSERQQERLLNEARALARVASPFVAKCFDAGDDGGLPFLVLEHVPGRSLAQIPREELSADQLLSIVTDVACGLRDVHDSGLVHRDVKPANIVIGDDGRARLVDFGMAHLMATPAEAASGTPAYMAPEQARGEVDRIDARTDVFGLGAVLYELLCGHAPFARTTRAQSLLAAQQGEVTPLHRRKHKSPNGLAEICLRCLAADKLRRYTTIDQFLDAIRRWRRRRWALRVAVAASVVFMLLLAVALAVPGSGFHFKRTPKPVSSLPRKSRWTTTEALNLEKVPGDVRRIFAVDDALRQDFAIQVDVLGAAESQDGVLRLISGDQITLRVTTERDCFITVLGCSAEPPVQLFPQQPFDNPGDARVLANTPTTLPRHTGERYAPIEAIPSTSNEALCIIASSRPIQLGSWDSGRFLVFRSAAQQENLRAAIRGLIRESESSNQAVSQLVIPFWVSGDPQKPAGQSME